MPNKALDQEAAAKSHRGEPEDHQQDDDRAVEETTACPTKPGTKKQQPTITARNQRTMAERRRPRRGTGEQEHAEEDEDERVEEHNRLRGTAVGSGGKRGLNNASATMRPQQTRP